MQLIPLPDLPRLDTAPLHRVEKGWGYELWLVNDDYCGKLLHFRQGKRCSWHYHRVKDEVFYLHAGRPVVACYSSPLLRAVQTAELVARPHRLPVIPLGPLTECDAGGWEGLDWDAVRAIDPDGYARFHADPALFGYPGGESYADVHRRAVPALAELLERHAGRAIVAVAHHVVNRTYLAGLLGLPPGQARRIVVGNGAVSVIVRHGGRTMIRALDAAADPEQR